MKSSPSLRVCFVLPSLHGGGAERAAVKLANHLDGGGYSPSVYLFERSGVYLDEIAPHVDVVSGSRGGRAVRIADLVRFIRRTRPHVVVSFLSFFSTFVATRGSGIGAKFVINQQTPLSGFLEDKDYPWRLPIQRRVFSLSARVVYPRADAIIATSQGVADDLVSNFTVPASKIHVLHNPVDLEEVNQRAREPLDPDVERLLAGAGDGPGGRAPVIVTAGRLAEAKNLPLFVAAVRLLRNRRPVQVLILGTGDQETVIRRAIDDEGLRGTIHLCGFQRNPWRYIARADLFVLTSRYEGFGNVLVEAMACGVPVVATRSAGTQEIIETESNGLLIDQHEPAAVADAIARILDSRPLHDRLATGARTSVVRYALPHVVGGYQRLFADLCRVA
jgi:glycosyltransferase involved in cell wall biosynthesis